MGVARPRSTPRVMRYAIRSSGASVGSSSGAVLRPATTNMLTYLGGVLLACAVIHSRVGTLKLGDTP